MRRRNAPKYSRRNKEGQEAEAISRQKMQAIDARTKEQFWQNFADKKCRGCGFLLEGNSKLSGYCGECLESVNLRLASEKNIEKERWLKSRELEQRLSAKRAK